jgi:hypothetical protein
MTMEIIALGRTSLPILFFAGLVLVILLSTVLRGSRRSARNKERSAVLQSMGFAEVPREQVFESVKAAGRIIEDYATSVIFSPVGKGTSALGETVIFDFQGIMGDPATNSRFTVVGFRVPPSIPDFGILHVLLLDRFVRKAADENASAPGVTGERKFGPFVVRPSDTPVQKRIAIEGHPEFGERYVVWTADEALMRRMLTPSLMDALTAMNDGKLRIRKGKDWIFVFREVMQPNPPTEFPALLEEAVGLVSRLDLRAASPTA